MVRLPSSEPVQYVGVYVLKWHDHPDQPEVGFVEVEEEKEFNDLPVKGIKEVKNHENPALLFTGAGPIPAEL